MEEKKGLGQMLSDFFAGKGFYIVLLLCAALIGASIWLMANGSRTDVEPAGNGNNVTVAQVPAPEQDTPADAAVPAMNETPRVTPGIPRNALVLPERDPEEPVIRPEAPTVQQEPPAEAGTEVSTMAESEPEADYFIWPVNGALQRGYSVEALSYDPTMADWRIHTGWDIAAPAGTHVLATANGTVSAVYTDQWLGNVVEVRHSNGLVSVYANLADEPAVTVGQSVRVGAVLGQVGSTALGEVGEVSHLHFAMRGADGAVDPTDWLPKP